jgi:superfamily II DNA or RNA helicase
VLIIGGGGKSSIRVVQQVGRVLRTRTGKESAVVYDFVDTPKFLARHYKVRRKLLESDFEVVDE